MAVARQRQPTCAECLAQALLAKARAALAHREKAGVSLRAEATLLLVGLSDGLHSRALLELLRRLQAEPGAGGQRRAFRFVAVRVVDDSTGREPGGDAPARWFAPDGGPPPCPCLSVPLSALFLGGDAGGDLAAELAWWDEARRAAQPWAVLDPKVAVRAPDSGGGGDELGRPFAGGLYDACWRRLHRLLGQARDETAREDLVEALRKQLLLRVAEACGASHVALGHCANTLACRVVQAVVKGRGYGVAGDVHYYDGRHAPRPPFVFPLRDCLSRDLHSFAHHCPRVGTRCVAARSEGGPVLNRRGELLGPARAAARRKSLNVLVEDFLAALQDTQPATVSTVLRTAAKLEAFPFNAPKRGAGPGAVHLCFVCGAPSCETNDAGGAADGEGRAPSPCEACTAALRFGSETFAWDLPRAVLPPHAAAPAPPDPPPSAAGVSAAGAGSPGARTKRVCAYCNAAKAMLKRPKTHELVCRECFYRAFEEEVHRTIVDHRLFAPGERVAIGASGGKDSTVLAHVLCALNERHGYGLDLVLLSIDEGISGYRDDSLATVKRNEAQYRIPLKVVSFEELYGWTMDAIVARVGLKNNCTFCGVFRRQALDRGATLLGVHKIATGHNADDIAETVLLNLLRGDYPRLTRCTASVTGEGGALPRVKPFARSYQKEIVMYAYHKRLDYFATECTYSPEAYRGFAREFVKDLEAAEPLAVLRSIGAAARMRFRGAASARMPAQRKCVRCGYITSQDVCKACLLLEGLNTGNPDLGVKRKAQALRKDPAKRPQIALAYE